MISRRFYKAVTDVFMRKTRSPCAADLNEHIGIVGLPFAMGQKKPGVNKAPTILRDAGMVSKLELMGHTVTDHGNLQFEKYEEDFPSFNIKYPRMIGAAAKKISEAVKRVVSSGQTCLNIGGDHSVSIGTVLGHAQANPDLTLFWIDAHSDINPPLASTSGNIHGMVVAFLLHELKEYIPPVTGLEWIEPCLRAKDIVYIGLRDIDPAERHIIETLGIACYTMHDIDRHGIDAVLDNAIERVNPGLTRPIHLSYDIDALDPTASPSTGTPVPGGLTIREGMYIAEQLAMTDKLACIDLVEVNPDLGTAKDLQLTSDTAIEVITGCFGKRRRGNFIPENYELPRPWVAESARL